MTSYVIYDVFTNVHFGGNPLAVIPDAGALREEDLQRIAREFNLSETAFVFPPDAPGADAKVRIFTPKQELPFAGHPTIGTAIALYNLGRVPAEMTLALKVGPIPVSVDGGKARFVTRVPLETWEMPLDVVAASAGLSADAIRTDRHAPVIASVGMPFAIAELRDPETLAAARPQTDAFRAFEPNWPTETHYDLLLYVRDGNHLRARMFAPLDGIPEDPATGSAAAALSAFLGQLDGTSQKFEISQGVAMGRPSQISAEVMVENGAPVEVAISGRAVKVMEGHLTF